jgi:hypothetical protein
MEKKNDDWVPGPNDTLDSLVARQQRTVMDFAKMSGVTFTKPLDDVIEAEAAEIMADVTDGSFFARVVRKIFKRNGNGTNGAAE